MMIKNKAKMVKKRNKNKKLKKINQLLVRKLLKKKII